ncbi:MAG: hypothetical protein K2K97_11865, partial [Muribaculaceae bacterium]|nr:hypothetical protein [Muribaculaceae bacterium]
MKEEIRMAVDKDIHQSARFKMGRARFCWIMFSLLWVLPVTVIGVLLIISIVLAMMMDIRYFIISLMITFILCPMVLVYVYYHYGLGKYCYFNVTDHCINIQDGGLLVDMFFSDVNDDEKSVVTENKIDTHKEECVRQLRIFIDYQHLRAYYVGRKSVFFPIGEKRLSGFLWIPESAYPDETTFFRAIEEIS